jgi:hypothetical protein
MKHSLLRGHKLSGTTTFSSRKSIVKKNEGLNNASAKSMFQQDSLTVSYVRTEPRIPLVG